jgi:hypothetical protein
MCMDHANNINSAIWNMNIETYHEGVTTFTMLWASLWAWGSNQGEAIDPWERSTRSPIGIPNPHFHAPALMAKESGATRSFY